MSKKVLVPVEPSDELLTSMAIRFDHGLGVPGYYDMLPFGACSHEERMRSTKSTMRQLHEEVVGAGFHEGPKPDAIMALAEFGRQCFNQAAPDSGDLEYDFIFEAAIEAGLLVAETRNEPCADGDMQQCCCLEFEADFPTKCYRVPSKYMSALREDLAILHDDWISAMERMPNNEDADFEHRIWVIRKGNNEPIILMIDQALTMLRLGHAELWKSTGLERPKVPENADD